MSPAVEDGVLNQPLTKLSLYLFLKDNKRTLLLVAYSFPLAPGLTSLLLLLLFILCVLLVSWKEFLLSYLCSVLLYSHLINGECGWWWQGHVVVLGQW